MNSREYAKFKRTFVGPVLTRTQAKRIRLENDDGMPAPKAKQSGPARKTDTRSVGFGNYTKNHATPIWANKRKIKEFYYMAKKLTENTGIAHQVDHIIPLRGELVCGLHVENNLQILTKSANINKSNSHSE